MPRRTSSVLTFSCHIWQRLRHPLARRVYGRIQTSHRVCHVYATRSCHILPSLVAPQSRPLNFMSAVISLATIPFRLPHSCHLSSLSSDRHSRATSLISRHIHATPRHRRVIYSGHRRRTGLFVPGALMKENVAHSVCAARPPQVPVAFSEKTLAATRLSGAPFERDGEPAD